MAWMYTTNMHILSSEISGNAMSVIIPYILGHVQPRTPNFTQVNQLQPNSILK